VSNSHRALGRRFDAEHGVVTEAMMFLGELDPEGIGPALAHATHYEPVPIPDFDALLDAVPSETIARSTFVDVGSGLGRAVFLAMRRPFRQIVGVEVSRALHETALDNFAAIRNAGVACRNVRFVCADARSWTYPPGSVVVFLFNPFDADALCETLDRIALRRDPGQTWLLYHTPEHRGIIDRRTDFAFARETAAGVVYTCGLGVA
jgi:SAM-dependent methyltransferase